MITTKCMTRLSLATVCVTFFALTATATDVSTPLSEDDVTLQNIKTFFEATFLKADFDEDGDLKIQDDALNTFVRVDKEKKLITFFSIFGLKASVPEIKKLQLVNTMNDELILVRFTMASPTMLSCDYQFIYEGGITPYTIVNNYRRYAKVTRAAVIDKDP